MLVLYELLWDFHQAIIIDSLTVEKE